MQDNTTASPIPRTSRLHPPLSTHHRQLPVPMLVDKEPYHEKKTRAKAPKVRTGCLTCRIRRVKCDEGKPHCRRCVQYGAECEGYASTQVKYIPYEVKQDRGIPQTAVISKIDSGPRFEDGVEAHYFWRFCNQFAADIAGPFAPTLWKQLIPQASEMEPYLKHCMAAVGALSTCHTFQDANSIPTHHDSSLPTSEVQIYALKQYDMALRGLRIATEKKEPQMRPALMACLLIFCFETLRGRQGPACHLLSSGLVLFSKWQAKQGRSDYSESRFLLGDELGRAFLSLDFQALLFLDDRSLSEHENLFNKSNRLLKLMPSKLSSLEEARMFWQLMMKRNLHFKAIAQLLGKAAELGGDKETIGWEDTADFAMGQVPFSRLKEPSPEIQNKCLKYIGDIQTWSRATADLFASIPASDRQSTIEATLLKIYAIGGMITLAGMCFVAETQFDAFLPEFHEELSLSASIHDEFTASPYHFDLGIIAAYHLVATRCRDRKLRGQAIDLLSGTPWREGVWDSVAVAAIAKWVRMLEEEGGNPDEFIPEHRRVFVTSLNLDLNNRRGHVYATRRKGVDGQDLDFLQALLTW